MTIVKRVQLRNYCDAQ